MKPMNKGNLKVIGVLMILSIVFIILPFINLTINAKSSTKRNTRIKVRKVYSNGDRNVLGIYTLCINNILIVVTSRRGRMLQVYDEKDMPMKCE